MTLQDDENGVKRAYRSTLRDEHTLVTRNAILDAAHELFLEDGYTATSIRKIADRAGVSEQTVYNNFGDKPTLLYEVGNRVVSGERSDDGRDLLGEITAETDPLRRIEMIAAESRRTYEEGMLQLESMLLDAAGSEPRVAEIAAGAWHQKYEDIERVFPAVFPEEVRNGDFDLDEAIDLVYAVQSAASIRILIEDRNWSWDKYERLLVTTLRRLFTRVQD